MIIGHDGRIKRCFPLATSSIIIVHGALLIISYTTASARPLQGLTRPRMIIRASSISCAIDMQSLLDHDQPPTWHRRRAWQ